MLTVIRTKEGKSRWLTTSSTHFKDRDKEIVSEKALAADVERADADGDFGPLRWWHVKGLDIGSCDFNEVRDGMLIESGTFHNEAIARAVEKEAPNLGVSIGFTHPADQPDAEGVFHDIKRYERSLLPIGSASNPYTTFSVKEKGMAPNTPERAAKKWRAFVDTVFQGDEDSAKAYAEQISARAEEIKGSGVAFKETREKAGIPKSQLFNEATNIRETVKRAIGDMDDIGGQVGTGNSANDNLIRSASSAAVDALTQALLKIDAVRRAIQNADTNKESDAASEKAAPGSLYGTDRTRVAKIILATRAKIDEATRLSGSADGLEEYNRAPGVKSNIDSGERALMSADNYYSMAADRLGKWLLENNAGSDKEAQSEKGLGEVAVEDLRDAAAYLQDAIASSNKKDYEQAYAELKQGEQTGQNGLNFIKRAAAEAYRQMNLPAQKKEARPTRVADRDPLASLLVDAKE